MQIETSYALVPFSRTFYNLQPAEESSLVNFHSREHRETGLRFLGSQTRETHWSYDAAGRNLDARPFSGGLIDLYV